MSTRALALMSCAVLILLGGVAMLAQATRPGDTRQLWEYRTEVARDRGVPPESRREAHRGGVPAAGAMLNAWRGEGWELVAVTRREVRVDDTIQTETLYAFKALPASSIGKRRSLCLDASICLSVRVRA